MTWSQVMWKIQNRKRAQKKRKTDAKNRKRAQFEKVFELIIHFRVSRVFFPLPDTFWKSVRLRFFCGFVALFLRIFCGFFASRCGGAMCQGMPMHDRALPKEQKPSGFQSQSQHLWSAPLFQEGYSALRSYTHAQGWKLFNTKPKLYMQQEIGNLSCMDWQCQYAVSSMDCSSSRARKKAVHAGPGFAWSKMGPEPKQWLGQKLQVVSFPKISRHGKMKILSAELLVIVCNMPPCSICAADKHAWYVCMHESWSACMCGLYLHSCSLNACMAWSMGWCMHDKHEHMKCTHGMTAGLHACMQAWKTGMHGMVQCMHLMRSA